MEKQLNITHREYLPVVVVVQYANHVRRIILSSAACLTLPYFSTLRHNGTIFEGKKTVLNIKCVFWFSLQLLSETFLIQYRNCKHVFM
jgi:hypothetical protein